jgi:hypothetical protein
MHGVSGFLSCAGFHATSPHPTSHLVTPMPPFFYTLQGVSGFLSSPLAWDAKGLGPVTGRMVKYKVRWAVGSGLGKSEER